MTDLDKILSVQRLQQLGIVNEEGVAVTDAFAQYLQSLEGAKKADVVLRLKQLVSQNLVFHRDGIPENVVFYACLIRDFTETHLTETDEDLLKLAEALHFLSNKPDNWAHLWKKKAMRKYYSDGTFAEGTGNNE